MSETISIVFPAHPAVFGTFLLAIVIYLVYSVVKVVVSLWTGA